MEVGKKQFLHLEFYFAKTDITILCVIRGEKKKKEYELKF